jgi:hypothetical protein
MKTNKSPAQYWTIIYCQLPYNHIQRSILLLTISICWQKPFQKVDRSHKDNILHKIVYKPMVFVWFGIIWHRNMRKVSDSFRIGEVCVSLLVKKSYNENFNPYDGWAIAKSDIWWWNAFHFPPYIEYFSGKGRVGNNLSKDLSFCSYSRRIAGYVTVTTT